MLLVSVRLDAWVFNRYKASLRCRPGARDAVNKLTPMCLPAPTDFWNTEVDGQKVWSELRSHSNMSFFDAFMSSSTYGIVSILPTEHATHVAMSGYHDKSRYEGDVALYAAMAAVTIGIKQIYLRRTYDLQD